MLTMQEQLSVYEEMYCMLTMQEQLPVFEGIVLLACRVEAVFSN